MSVTKEKRERIKQHIIGNVTEYPHNIVRKTAEEFGITKSAVFKYIKKLMSENVLESTGERRNIIYRLKSSKHAVKLEIDPDMAEDQKTDKTEKSERNIVEYKKAVREEVNIPAQKVGSKNPTLASIAVILAAIVIVISLIFVFTSRQRQVVELNSVLERIDVVETKLVEIVQEGKKEKREKGFLELRKALLNLQDVKNLITDDELAKKLLKIEDDIKSVLVLPEAKEGDEKQRVE